MDTIWLECDMFVCERDVSLHWHSLARTCVYYDCTIEKETRISLSIMTSNRVNLPNIEIRLSNLHAHTEWSVVKVGVGYEFDSSIASKNKALFHMQLTYFRRHNRM
jgi:predicted neuraminidase